MNIQPLGARLLLRRCYNDDIRDERGDVLIELPMGSRNLTPFFEIVGVGPKCRYFKGEHIGKVVRPKSHHSNSNYKFPDDENIALVGEDNVEEVLYG